MHSRNFLLAAKYTRLHSSPTLSGYVTSGTKSISIRINATTSSNGDVFKVPAKDNGYFEWYKPLNYVISSLAYAFLNNSTLLSIDVSNLDTSTVNSMASMFSSCRNLESITGLNCLDTSHTTTCYQMFSNCISLTEIVCPDWDLSLCSDFRYFADGCSDVELIDARNWKLPESGSMNLTRVFNCANLLELSIDNWELSEATSKTNFLPNNGAVVYYNSEKFTDTSVIDTFDMEWVDLAETEYIWGRTVEPNTTFNARLYFNDSSSATKLTLTSNSAGYFRYVLPSGSTITRLVNAFSGGSSFDTENVLKVISFNCDLNSVTSTRNMFFSQQNLERVYWNGNTFDSCTDFYYMFRDCYNLHSDAEQYQDWSNWGSKEESITNISYMIGQANISTNPKFPYVTKLGLIRVDEGCNTDSVYANLVNLQDIPSCGSINDTLLIWAPLTINSLKVILNALQDLNGRSAMMQFTNASKVLIRNNVELFNIAKRKALLGWDITTLFNTDFICGTCYAPYPETVTIGGYTANVDQTDGFFSIDNISNIASFNSLIYRRTDIERLKVRCTHISNLSTYNAFRASSIKYLDLSEVLYTSLTSRPVGGNETIMYFAFGANAADEAGGYLSLIETMKVPAIKNPHIADLFQTNMFVNCRSLRNIHVCGAIDISVALVQSPLTLASAKVVLNALQDVTDTTLHPTGETLTFSASTKALINADTEALNLVNEKRLLGWTIAL